MQYRCIDPKRFNRKISASLDLSRENFFLLISHDIQIQIRDSLPTLFFLESVRKLWFEIKVETILMNFRVYADGAKAYRYTIRLYYIYIYIRIF